jgi:predicted nuclease with TOPRIM domain
MRLFCEFRCRIFLLTILMISSACIAFSGVSGQIQEQYKKEYQNKAIFLKIPVYSEKQLVHVNDQKIRAEQGLGTPRYKVGDQLRILAIDFTGDEIKFRMGAISSTGVAEIIFKFDSNLQDSFPNREVFDRALQSTFTEGLKYTDIEDAKRSFVEQEFDRSVRDIAGSASINRETVLKNIAPQVPAYQDAQRDIENLKNALQDIKGQLTQALAENRKLDSTLKTEQAELSRLKNANAALQEKIDSSTQQVSRLGEDLRDAKGTTQGYQQGIANIQRSLNIKVEPNRDLAMQIADLGQAIRKLQKDNESLTNQIASVRTNLEAQQAANGRLVSENEELKSSNHQMQSTIKTLSSNEDSLARKYLDLENAKKRIDDFAQVVRALRTRVVEEKNEAGERSAKANIYLKNTLLGFLEWSLPANIGPGNSKSCEIGFTAESIDYVRLTPEERHMLHTLGDRLKMKIDLASGSATMEVMPEKKESLREVGERDRATWIWKIENHGSQDARLLISARLINKNSEEISFLQQENTVLASNIVRQVRSYLQPIPLAVGAVIGFLIFGIVGIFRRPKRPINLSNNPPEPPAYAGRKEL